MRLDSRRASRGAKRRGCSGRSDAWVGRKRLLEFRAIHWRGALQVVVISKPRPIFVPVPLWVRRVERLFRAPALGLRG